MAPIKRHEALVSFSRDHHNGLLLVWKIRQGLKMNVEPARIASYVQFAFTTDLEPHFQDEEKYLFPLLNKEDQGRSKAEADHSKLRELNEELKNEARAEWLTQFADLLEAHIRFEERDLFNEIQALPSELLSPIAEKFSGHTCAGDDGWKDHFWIAISDRNSRER